jgi:hypothetical protein
MYNRRQAGSFDDNFSENDVLNCLDRAGKKYKNGQRYILAQCPTHDDENPSVQIYKDDWFVNCHATCGRYHITKAFPELNGDRRDGHLQTSNSQRIYKESKVSEHVYKTYDLMADWEAMPLIPRDHVFKGLPLEVLDDLGWRWDAAKNSYFIPYFTATKRAIPFAQWRHLSGERRFTFLKDGKPTCYGTWNLDNHKLFVVEGTSDCAVLEYCSVPWIGLPSAASGELMKKMATHCQNAGIELVYAGDRDSAGDKLKEALDSVMSYRIKQPRTPYKDWGEMFEAEGFQSVQDYCFVELFGPSYTPDPVLAAVQAVWPGAEELEIVSTEEATQTAETMPAL